MTGRPDMRVPNEKVLGMVSTILDATKDVFIHDHGAFTNECGPDCGWYVATKKASLDEAFEDNEVTGFVVAEPEETDGN